ncbi:hypothetical protein BKA65DRAFT_149351 [Rhexocercosporidium sp. MPI-PUGE-AT-0058]|nr:hypothetical protein BKA65DRAFT_149351 [Rhexocercosporidium sp. MPI-PUGE-AT-0058]
MTQQENRNGLPLQFASKESELCNEYPRNHFDVSWNGNSSNLDVPNSSFGVGYVKKTGDLTSFSQDAKAAQNSLPARVEQPGIIANCGPENPNPDLVVLERELGWQTAPQGQISGSIDPEQDSAKAGEKAPDGNLNSREIVFGTAATTSTPHVQEISFAKGRTGPMSPNSRTKTKSVKDAGGACWRCKYVGKGCDPGDPCSSCPRKSTSWHALGCRRGTLWDVLPRVILCPQAGEQPESTPGEHPKSTIASVKEHGVIANLANIYLPPSQTGSTASLSRLLPSAAWYQTTTNDQLIELSLLCLQTSLEAIKAQKESEPQSFSHITCTSSACKIESLHKLDIYLKEYIKLLSDIIFKKNARHCKDWWFSVFYGFCIQSFVREALIVLESRSDANQITAASQYLHLAVNLFFVTCNATSKGYDPLSYDFDNLSPVEMSILARNHLQAEEGRLAQVAVQKDLWEINGIESSYDFLGQLFGMDRTIFVPPASRPPAYGDGSETTVIPDEATYPPPKKRRLDKQHERGYTSDDSVSTQILDTHIIHPGSLALLDSTAELPPTIPDFNNDCSVRENPVLFESDMYTPRWVRGFRGEEGWCGFCSKWLKLGDAWFNDRCLFHGICADTRKGFAEPKEPVKINLAKQIWEAKCETCGVNVRYRKGDRRHYSGWYMHVVNCGIKNPIAEIGEETEGDMAILM